MENNRFKEVHIEQIKQALDTAPSREELMERKIRAFDFFLRNL